MMASSFQLRGRRQPVNALFADSSDDEDDFGLKSGSSGSGAPTGAGSTGGFDGFDDDDDWAGQDGWTAVGQKRRHPGSGAGVAGINGFGPNPGEVAPALDPVAARRLRDQLQAKIRDLGDQQAQMLSRVNRSYGVDLKIQVLQAAFTTGCSLNLRTLAERLRNAVWDSRTNSVIVRIHRRLAPGEVAGDGEEAGYTAHFQIYPSGKVTILGTRSIVDMYREARRMARRIQKIAGFPSAMLKNFRIRNLSGHCRLPFAVSLAKLNELKELQDVITYDPESFPRVIVHMIHPRCTVQVFANGSVLFSGLTAVSDLCEAFQKFFPLVQMVRAQVNLLDSVVELEGTPGAAAAVFGVSSAGVGDNGNGSSSVGDGNSSTGSSSVGDGSNTSSNTTSITNSTSSTGTQSQAAKPAVSGNSRSPRAAQGSASVVPELEELGDDFWAKAVASPVGAAATAPPPSASSSETTTTTSSTTVAPSAATAEPSAHPAGSESAAAADAWSEFSSASASYSAAASSSASSVADGWSSAASTIPLLQDSFSSAAAALDAGAHVVTVKSEPGQVKVEPTDPAFDEDWSMA